MTDVGWSELWLARAPWWEELSLALLWVCQFPKFSERGSACGDWRHFDRKLSVFTEASGGVSGGKLICLYVWGSLFTVCLLCCGGWEGGETLHLMLCCDILVNTLKFGQQPKIMSVNVLYNWLYNRLLTLICFCCDFVAEWQHYMWVTLQYVYCTCCDKPECLHGELYKTLINSATL